MEIKRLDHHVICIHFEAIRRLQNVQPRVRLPLFFFGRNWAGNKEGPKASVCVCVCRGVREGRIYNVRPTNHQMNVTKKEKKK